MTTKFQSLKEQLRTLENESARGGSSPKKSGSGKLMHSGFSTAGWIKSVLLIGFLGTFLLYAGTRYTSVQVAPSIGPVAELFSNRPSPAILEAMSASMEEMGYTGLTEEQLIELRQQGVTATYTRRIRDVGYSEVTLDQVTRLAQSGASATFVAMISELGYDLSVEELIELEQHDVTAYFTSNMHDLGYTDITTDELIRLRDVGTTIDDVEALSGDDGELPSIEEIIRYRISNQ